jgi:dipeptidyl aminopeptidase/acylaminoacyl peptidase
VPAEPILDGEREHQRPLGPATVEKRWSVPVLAAFAIGGLAIAAFATFLLFGGGGPTPTGGLAGGSPTPTGGLGGGGSTPTGELAVQLLANPPSLALTSPLGGEIRPIVLNGPASDPGWGPNRQLVYVRSGGLRILGSSGSDDQPLTDPGSGHDHPSWSVATNRIAFTGPHGTDKQEILVIPATGGPIQALTDSPGEDRGPSWSPDGSRIAFVSARSGNRDIWVMDDHGQNLRNLTDETFNDIDPAWSPDGSLIAYASNQEDGYQIWVIPAEGGERRRITRPAGTSDQDPAWSPDGKFLAFYRGSPEYVVVVDLEGNELATIKGADGARLVLPAWGH